MIGIEQEKSINYRHMIELIMWKKIQFVSRSINYNKQDIFYNI